MRGVADFAYPNSKTRRGRVCDSGNVAPTLICTSDICRIERGGELGWRIRKLTERECMRLMDFSDSDVDAMKKVNSRTRIYEQAGNSIVVGVLEAIIGEMI